MSDCRHNAPDRGPDEGDVQTQRQQLDEQDRERLLDQLIDCLYSVESDEDTAAVDRCLEELEAAGALCGNEFDVERGLKDFHERFSMAFENDPPHEPPEKIQPITPVKRRPVARIAIIAAALCACFLATVQASGFDIIGAIAKWTSEKFSFVKLDGASTEDERGIQHMPLQDTLIKHRITEQLAPTQFPEGTELLEIQIREEKGNTSISATYELNGEKFFISIRNIGNAPYKEIEINDSDVESYWAGGIEHHLMTDVKQRKAMWRNGTWECRISGNLDREELLLMIDSVYEE